MLEFLRESVLVVDEQWAIKANLSAPAGLLGWGDPTGIHLLAHVHPDDVLRFIDTGTGLRETDLGWSGSAVVRLKRVDETYGHYEITLHNRIGDPAIDGMVIATREVGAPVTTAPELAPTHMVASLADHLPVGVVIVADSGLVIYANEAACKMVGTTRDRFIAEGLAGLVHEADRLELNTLLRELRRWPGRRKITVAAGPDRSRRLEVDFASHTGADLAPDGSEQVRLVVAIVEDVTNRVEREEQLEERANRDELTGLKNRAWLLDHLHVQLRAGADLTIAFIDLVGFKTINDELGHPAGDQVLTAVAQGVAHAIDASAQAARVGGDEFVVVQQGLSEDDHGRLAASIRGAVAEVGAAIEVSVAASVGVVRSRPGEVPWDVLARADAAMYADKRNRRE